MLNRVTTCYIFMLQYTNITMVTVVHSHACITQCLIYILWPLGPHAISSCFKTCFHFFRTFFMIFCKFCFHQLVVRSFLDLVLKFIKKMYCLLSTLKIQLYSSYSQKREAKLDFVDTRCTLLGFTKLPNIN